MTFGLRQKLVAILLPIIILPLLGLGFIFYTQQRDMLQASALEKMKDVMDATRNSFATSMTSRYAGVKLLSESHLIRRYIIIEDEGARYYSFYRPILELFASYQDTFPEFSELRLLNAAGEEEVRLAKPDMPNMGESIFKQSWLKEAELAGNKLLTKVVSEQNADGVSVFIIKPIPSTMYSDWKLSGSSAIGGYLVVTVELKHLIGIIEKEHIGETGHMLLLDTSGMLLAPSTAHTVAQKQANEVASVARVLYEQRNYFDGNIRVLNVDNERYLASSSPLLDGLSLYSYWPEKEKLAIVETVALRVFWFTVFTLLAVSVLIFLVVNRLVIHPIFLLRELTLDIGRGGFNYLGPDSGKFIESGEREDEIGELTRAIHEMSINLEASRLKMQFNAFHDSLTGLNNRHSFVTYLQRAIERSAERKGEIAVLFIDTDGFKEVNDTLGHVQGDNVLRVIAKRLSRGSRLVKIAKRLGVPEERIKLSLNRIGGDEFAVVIEGFNPTKEADLVATSLIDEMKEAFIVDHQVYHLGISIGVSVFPKDGENVNTLLKRADIAMYKAKADGGNRYQFYDPALEQSAIERHQMEIELRKALDEQQFCLFYQPQFDAQSGELVGSEALIRWKHPERGMVPPGLFISHAEENGLIVRIGEWALEEACRQNKVWQDAGLIPVKVAVNFSTVQFNRMEDIVSMITSKLEKTGLDARYLDVEITETGIMQSGDVGLDVLHEIKAVGVQLSMDDFGTGYSSLSSLRDMPIDTLKIDKSFVDDINTGANGQAIIKAIMALAKQLGLKVVAEGVEEESQLEFLKQNDCETIQGYLLGRPLPAEELEAVLQQHTYQDGLVKENNEATLKGDTGYSI